MSSLYNRAVTATQRYIVERKANEIITTENAVVDGCDQKVIVFEDDDNELNFVFVGVSWKADALAFDEVERIAKPSREEFEQIAFDFLTKFSGVTDRGINLNVCVLQVVDENRAFLRYHGNISLV